MPSPFLAMPESTHVAANALAFAVEDRFPVSPGHTLVIPRREVRTWFDATRAEQTALLDLVDAIKQRLDARRPSPDGYNVGFNAGEVAGQTVMHLHVHVIPRYRGDMDDRGGVLHVIPSKGNYLAGVGDAPRVVADPAFVEKLLTLLDQGQFTATYKFAVLLGLVDLCMEHATVRGAAPPLVTTGSSRRRCSRSIGRRRPRSVGPPPCFGRAQGSCRTRRSSRSSGPSARLHAHRQPGMVGDRPAQQ